MIGALFYYFKRDLLQTIDTARGALNKRLIRGIR